MSGETRDTPEGRGARRRQEQREQRERAAAVRWWTRPGVLVFLVLFALAVAGWVLVIQAGRRIPAREATIGGLSVRLADARWVLDQMDHGENFRKPSTMMPDMPEWGNQRVSLDLVFHNRSRRVHEFRGEEFLLVPELGGEVPPYGAAVGHAVLAPGQMLNTELHFDFDTEQPHGRLLAEWRRNGKSKFFPIPEPPEHYHLRPRGGEIALPPNGDLVIPLGRQENGRALYMGVYGCVACHGDPEVPESNNIGPHLAGIGTTAATRAERSSAAQYLYESILAPNAVIAPACERGRPCQDPSAMPEYASLVTLNHVADLLVYLLSLEAE